MHAAARDRLTTGEVTDILAAGSTRSPVTHPASATTSPSVRRPKSPLAANTSTGSSTCSRLHSRGVESANAYVDAIRLPPRLIVLIATPLADRAIDDDTCRRRPEGPRPRLQAPRPVIGSGALAGMATAHSAAATATPCLPELIESRAPDASTPTVTPTMSAPARTATRRLSFDLADAFQLRKTSAPCPHPCR